MTIKIETSTQLATLIGTMRNALRANADCGQSLRDVERDGFHFTLGVARTGYVSINYSHLSPDLRTAQKWRVEADCLDLGPVDSDGL